MRGASLNAHSVLATGSISLDRCALGSAEKLEVALARVLSLGDGRGDGVVDVGLLGVGVALVG